MYELSIHLVSSIMMELTLTSVRLDSVSSFSSLVWITHSPSDTGTFVNRDLTVVSLKLFPKLVKSLTKHRCLIVNHASTMTFSKQTTVTLAVHAHAHRGLRVVRTNNRGDPKECKKLFS